MTEPTFSVRCGCRLGARQMLFTVDLLTPCCAASVRQLQCVIPAGLVCSVASTMAAILSISQIGFRPRPGATSHKPPVPIRRNASARESRYCGSLKAASRSQNRLPLPRHRARFDSATPPVAEFSAAIHSWIFCRSTGVISARICS